MIFVLTFVWNNDIWIKRAFFLKFSIASSIWHYSTKSRIDFLDFLMTTMFAFEGHLWCFDLSFRSWGNDTRNNDHFVQLTWLKVSQHSWILERVDLNLKGWRKSKLIWHWHFVNLNAGFFKLKVNDLLTMSKYSFGLNLIASVNFESKFVKSSISILM